MADAYESRVAGYKSNRLVGGYLQRNVVTTFLDSWISQGIATVLLFLDRDVNKTFTVLLCLVFMLDLDESRLTLLPLLTSVRIDKR